MEKLEREQEAKARAYTGVYRAQADINRRNRELNTQADSDAVKRAKQAAVQPGSVAVDGDPFSRRETRVKSVWVTSKKGSDQSSQSNGNTSNGNGNSSNGREKPTLQSVSQSMSSSLSAPYGTSLVQLSETMVPDSSAPGDHSSSSSLSLPEKITEDFSLHLTSQVISSLSHTHSLTFSFLFIPFFSSFILSFPLFSFFLSFSHTLK